MPISNIFMELGTLLFFMEGVSIILLCLLNSHLHYMELLMILHCLNIHIVLGHSNYLLSFNIYSISSRSLLVFFIVSIPKKVISWNTALTHCVFSIISSLSKVFWNTQTTWLLRRFFLSKSVEYVDQMSWAVLYFCMQTPRLAKLLFFFNACKHERKIISSLVRDLTAW